MDFQNEGIYISPAGANMIAEGDKTWGPNAKFIVYKQFVSFKADLLRDCGWVL